MRGLLRGGAIAASVLGTIVLPTVTVHASKPGPGFTMAVYGDSPYGSGATDPP